MVCNQILANRGTVSSLVNEPNKTWPSFKSIWVLKSWYLPRLSIIKSFTAICSRISRWILANIKYFSNSDPHLRYSLIVFNQFSGGTSAPRKKIKKIQNIYFQNCYMLRKFACIVLSVLWLLGAAQRALSQPQKSW